MNFDRPRRAKLVAASCMFAYDNDWHEICSSRRRLVYARPRTTFENSIIRCEQYDPPPLTATASVVAVHFSVRVFAKDGKSILVDCVAQLHDRVHFGSFFDFSLFAAIFRFVNDTKVSRSRTTDNFSIVPSSTSSSSGVIVLCLTVLENIFSNAVACGYCRVRFTMNSEYFLAFYYVIALAVCTKTKKVPSSVILDFPPYSHYSLGALCSRSFSWLCVHGVWRRIAYIHFHLFIGCERLKWRK